MRQQVDREDQRPLRISFPRCLFRGGIKRVASGECITVHGIASAALKFDPRQVGIRLLLWALVSEGGDVWATRIWVTVARPC